MPRPAPRVDRRAFLTYLGTSPLAIVILGCASPPAPGKIGQRVQQAGVAVLLEGVVRRTVFSQHNATTRAQPDQAFVLVRMTVENILAPRFENPPDIFTLTTADGRIFKPLEIGFHLPAPSRMAVTPGMSSRERAVFEVPSASGNLTLIYQPAGLQAIRFEISPPAELPAEPDA